MNQAEGHPTRWIAKQFEVRALRGSALKFVKRDGGPGKGKAGLRLAREDAGEARPIGRAQPGLDLSHKHFRTRKRKNEDSCGFRRACVIPNAQL